MLNANNNPLLYSMINDLHGLLVQRSQQIGGRLRQPGRFNTSELIEFTLLSLVNRHLGEVSHLKTLPLLHPEALWHCWLPFATELATWTSQRSAESVLPIYDHDRGLLQQVDADAAPGAVAGDGRPCYPVTA